MAQFNAFQNNPYLLQQNQIQQNQLQQPVVQPNMLQQQVNNPCERFARYLIIYNGNIAVPTGGTVEEISLGITVSGEVENATISRYTPAAVEQYGSVGSARYVTVPRGCCYNIAVENLTDQNILVDNLNVIVIRTAI